MVREKPEDARAEDDPSWSAYGRTILEWQSAPRWRIDLSQPITLHHRAAFMAAGLPGSFGLMTPENPRGIAISPAANAERWQRFRRTLPSGIVGVDGLDRDSSHREHGVALAWPCRDVVALARQWEQSAIYWFDGVAMWVLGAWTQAAPWRLGGGV